MSLGNIEALRNVISEPSRQNFSQGEVRINPNRVALLIACYTGCFPGASPSYSQQDQTPKPGHSSWRDPSDGWLDLSEMLAKPGHFVPIMMPITEPAGNMVKIARGPIGSIMRCAMRNICVTMNVNVCDPPISGAIREGHRRLQSSCTI